MKYSRYNIEEITFPLYEQIANILIDMTDDEDIKRKLKGILYEGGFDNYCVDGSLKTQKEVFLKNNALIK